MAEHKITTTDEQIRAAFERGKLLEAEPLAVSVEHVQDRELLIVSLSNHRRLVLPLEDIQGLAESTPEQLAEWELLGRGTGIRFPQIDVDLYVPALIKGVYGNRRWMSKLRGKGGAVETIAKHLSARAAGTAGGRARKTLAAGG